MPAWLQARLDRSQVSNILVLMEAESAGLLRSSAPHTGQGQHQDVSRNKSTQALGGSEGSRSSKNLFRQCCTPSERCRSASSAAHIQADLMLDAKHCAVHGVDVGGAALESYLPGGHVDTWRPRTRAGTVPLAARMWGVGWVTEPSPGLACAQDAARNASGSRAQSAVLDAIAARAGL